MIGTVKRIGTLYNCKNWYNCVRFNDETKEIFDFIFYMRKRRNSYRVVFAAETISPHENYIAFAPVRKAMLPNRNRINGT